jgi:hypothetical protein
MSARASLTLTQRAWRFGVAITICFSFLNTESQQFLLLLPEMDAKSVLPVINRPFAMGGLVAGASFVERAHAAFSFLRGRLRGGIVLTGTSKMGHLDDNVAAFIAAAKTLNRL